MTIYNGLIKPGIAAGDNTALGNPSAPTPPDSTGAIGTSHYVEMSNAVIHVWDRSLNSVSAASLSTFFGATAPYCDPQVQWDPAAGRFLFAALVCNTSSTAATFQAFLFGWSKTGDPSNLSTASTGGWCLFNIRTQPLLLDYIKLGHNSNYMIMAGNFIDMSSPAQPFVSAAIYWATLPPNGNQQCSLPSAGGTPISTPLKDGDGVANAFTPVPVNTDSPNPGDGYIVSAYDPSGGNGQAGGPRSKLAVWHLDSSGVLHQDPDVGVPAYDVPPASPQLNGSVPIDTLDARLTQAVGDPVSGIWTQHTVANGGVSKVTWYELALSGPALALVQQGDVTSGADFIFNAAISPSTSGHGAGIEYSRSNSAIDPVIEVRFRTSGTPSGQMEPGATQLAASSAADKDLSCTVAGSTVCRWGDYSGLTPDPLNIYLVWGTNEINTAATSAPAWQNYNFAFFAAMPPTAPTGVSVASQGDGFACISWQESSYDFGAPLTSFTVKAYQGASLAQSIVLNPPSAIGCINGLTNGVAYTFTVTATNDPGSTESAATGPITLTRAPSASGAAGAPPRAPANPATPVGPPPRK